MAASLRFWFEFASTYSYISAMRIDDEAKTLGVTVEWTPFLLGPIFKKNGWNTSPFNIYEAKGRYMWRDVERQCHKYGLRVHPGFQAGSVSFPQNGLVAARVAIAALDQNWGKAFCRQIFLAQFRDGRDIADPLVVGDSIAEVGGDAEYYLDLASTNRQKDRLRRNVEEAEAFGVFGAPSFVVDRELFWGDDRLGDALAWACR